MVPSRSTITRRHLLSIVSAVLVPVSGCQIWGRNEQEVKLHEVQIRNDDTERHSISIRVEENGETVFNREYDLDPGARKVIQAPISERGAYIVSASYKDGNYSRNPSAGIDEDKSCVVVVWEISRSGAIAGYENYYTRCSSRTDSA